MDYKLVGDHPEILEGGRPVAPGEVVTLTDQEMNLAINAALIQHGVLMAVEDMPVEETDVDATPAAVEFALAKGVNLEEVTGTGENGRITKTDVENHDAKGGSQ